MVLLSFADLNAALTRCMTTHPPVGLELAMHPDAICMAELWAPMVLQRLECVPVATVGEKVLAAFRRWQLPTEG